MGTVYHLREHRWTGQAPLQRFLAGCDGGAPTLPTPAQLHEALLWSERCTVTKTATISLHGNSHDVDAALVGRRGDGASANTPSEWSPARSVPAGPSLFGPRWPAWTPAARPASAWATRRLEPAASMPGSCPRSARSRASTKPQNAELLATETAERDRAVVLVLVLDETHLLSVDVLEELRLLTNADMDSRSPFARLLVGQPLLAPTEQARHLRRAAPADRSALRDERHDAAETKTHLSHHLQLAGRSDTLFSNDAITLLHQVSRSLPRAVTNLAVHARIAAFAGNKSIVDEGSARASVTHVRTE